jgi:putative (di)nucleoside polyphosphate hydrolase
LNVSGLSRFADVPAGYRPNVGVVLIDPRGMVFAGQRYDQEVPAWQMPQGGIDAGETPVEAALRELEEETGVAPRLVEVLAETADWLAYDLPPDLAARIWGGRYRGQAQKWVALRFLGTDADIDIARHHKEFSRWRWLPPDAVVDGIIPFKRAIYAAVLSEFRPLLVPGSSKGAESPRGRRRARRDR